MKQHPTQLTILLGGLAIFALILSGCQSPAINEQAPDEAPLVTVSILPQAYFVERIAGESLRINVMVGPGDEPHTYEPTPEQMRLLSDSQIFFSMGVEYETNWIPRFLEANPNLTIVDSGSGIERIALADHHHHPNEEDHGHTDEAAGHHDEEDHQHADEEAGENLDPHVWLAPQNGRIIAANILEALVTLAPEHEDAFQENYNDLIADIEALETNIETSLAGISQRAFMVFHPAWGYFADQFGLEQVPVQVGGQDPSPRELTALIETAREENIRVIFIQPSFNAASAEAIAEEINAAVAVADPLATDWLKNLEAAADAFAAALSN